MPRFNASFVILEQLIGYYEVTVNDIFLMNEVVQQNYNDPKIGAKLGPLIGLADLDGY